MLNVTKLSAGYDGKAVLKDVSFRAKSGAVTVILGPNGCGKSTLLKSICGILPADGEAKLGEENLLKLPPKELAKRAAYLAQSRQIPDITAERMVLHGRFPYLSYPRRYRPQDIAAAKTAMERMGIADLAARLVFAPYELPVGILLSVLGGPFFLLLLFRGKRGGRGA